jgi:hypothetical protein
VFGPLLSIEDFINPTEEQEIFEDSPYAFPGGDLEIVGQVLDEIQVEKGEVLEIDSEDSGEGQDPDANASCCDTIDLIARLERLSIKYRGNSTLDLTCHLHEFCGLLRHEELSNTKQSSLEEYFPVAPSS